MNSGENKTDINLPEPSPIHNIHTKMDELQRFEGVHEWKGIFLFAAVFYSYLYHRYNQTCVPGSNTDLDTDFRLRLYEDSTALPNYYAKSNDIIMTNICKCIKKGVDILLIPISITRSYGGDHANLLIYRKINNTFELFEPHGHVPLNNVYVDFIADINLRLQTTDKYQLIYNENVCPRYDGLQALAEDSTKQLSTERGYCQAWSMFFAELVLMNPKKTSKQLMENIFQKLDSLDNMTPSDYLLNVIRGYVNLIRTIADFKMKTIFGDDFSLDEFLQLNKKGNTDEEHARWQKIYYTHKNVFAKEVEMFQTDRDTFLEALQLNNKQEYNQFINYISILTPSKKPPRFSTPVKSPSHKRTSISPNRILSRQFKTPIAKKTQLFKNTFKPTAAKLTTQQKKKTTKAYGNKNKTGTRRKERIANKKREKVAPKKRSNKTKAYGNKNNTSTRRKQRIANEKRSNKTKAHSNKNKTGTRRKQKIANKKRSNKPKRNVYFY
jgi:hypothetical protein